MIPRPDVRASRPHQHRAGLLAALAPLPAVALPVPLYLIPFFLALVAASWVSAAMSMRGRPGPGRDLAGAALVALLVIVVGTLKGYTSVAHLLVAVCAPATLLVLAAIEASRADDLRRRAWGEAWQMRRTIDLDRRVRPSARGVRPAGAQDREERPAS